MCVCVPIHIGLIIISLSCTFGFLFWTTNYSLFWHLALIWNCVYSTLIWTCIDLEVELALIIYLNFKSVRSNGLFIESCFWFCLIFTRENIRILNVPIEQ